MIKPGYQRYGYITNKGSIYTFHNFRDFHRTSERGDQKQNRITEKVDIKKLKKMDIYINPFAFHNLIGHTILTFEFTDKKRICLTVEAQLNVGEEYSMIKGVYPGYKIRYIRGTEQDIIRLRFFRKEKVYRYPLHVNKSIMETLFLAFVKETNKAEKEGEPYNLLSNNCTSGLRSTAKKYLPIPRRHYSLLFNAFLPKFLKKIGILNPSEKKRIYKI